ncbi:cytochrome P450 [Mycena rosella]|uniref:Cytochrome P450 n=1 Tax=Mycena rosella TaxID=1033263 RepID=A0AAD7DZR0_MYCRO|nr:cytochrome P450 [Mycena rosella]
MILASSIGACVVTWLLDAYLNVHSLRWVFLIVCLLSFPLVFIFKVQYTLWTDRHAATAHGATLPPTLPSVWCSSPCAKMRRAILASSLHVIVPLFINPRLGEPVAKVKQNIGHTFCMRILFENRNAAMFITTEPEYLKVNADFVEEYRVLIHGVRSSLRVDLTALRRVRMRGRFSGTSLARVSSARTGKYGICNLELFDRHSMEGIAHIKKRLQEGYPIDFQVHPSPYPGGHRHRHRTRRLPSLRQLVAFERFPFGASWPLSEFWHDKIQGPMSVIRAFLGPILGEAVARRREHGSERHLHIKEGTAQNREVQEGETLVDHLLSYTEGTYARIPHRRLIYIHLRFCCADRTMLRDEILNISVAGRDTVRPRKTPARAPTPEDFREMKYLCAVLNETLRMYPPLNFNMRSTTTPVILPSTTGGQPFYLPAHPKVPFSVLNMHRRTDLWGPDAAQWDPEQFIDERLHKYRLSILVPVRAVLVIRSNSDPKLFRDLAAARGTASGELCPPRQRAKSIILGRSVG